VKEKQGETSSVSDRKQPECSPLLVRIRSASPPLKNERRAALEVLPERRRQRLLTGIDGLHRRSGKLPFTYKFILLSTIKS
jgi:hypothetical protein